MARSSRLACFRGRQRHADCGRLEGQADRLSEGRSAGTRLTNWVMNGKMANGALPPPRRENWSRAGKLQEVLPFAKRLRLPNLDVEALIRATPQFFEYPECDRDPLPWWTQGHVTLLGDAAHPCILPARMAQPRPFWMRDAWRGSCPNWHLRRRSPPTRPRDYPRLRRSCAIIVEVGPSECWIWLPSGHQKASTVCRT
jgi:hypothetical protein